MSTLPDLSTLKVRAINYEDTVSVNNNVAEPFPDHEEDQEIPEDEPEQPEKSPDIIRQEQDARLILGLYKSKFPTELKVLSKDFDSLDLMDLAQLNELRDRCDKILGAGSGLDAKKKLFNAIVFVLEKVGCASGVQCEGLTGNLLNDKDFQRDIMRLCLKYLSADECKPEITVPMKIVTTAMQLHANSEIKANAPLIEEQLSSINVNDATISVKAVPPGPSNN